MIFSTVVVSFLAATAAAYPNIQARAANKKVDFSNWQPTDPNNAVSCPFTASLANHGFLPRRGITQDNIKSTLTDVLQLDGFLANLFATQSTPLGYKLANGTEVVDLYQLNKHGGIEHDSSLSRSDTYFGDNFHFNKTLYAQMKSFSTDGKYLTLDQLTKFRAAREADSKKRNPEWDFGIKQQFTAYGEAALLLIAMSDSTGNIRLDWTDILFQEEKFPVELGWTPRPINTARVLALAGEMRLKNFF
ncbi:hypothetical protein HDU97_001396 [Phlyctochytrium planicorne]|nr:hypothetical protein HDU97_001396 [Phlyctochytrium planicorne]